MRKSKWQRQANRRWSKKAVWIHGDGPFAVLAWCGELSVTLWQTNEEAEQAKARIDGTGCGGRCVRHHEIVDMSESTQAALPGADGARRGLAPRQSM